MSRHRLLIPGLIIMMLIGSVSLVPEVRANEAEDAFRSEAEQFLRETRTLYARAETVRVDDAEDSFVVEFAYRYPEEMIQWVRYADGREQIVIHRDDVVALAFPHLNVYRKGDVEDENFQEQLAGSVPVLGLVLVLMDQEEWPDEVTVTEEQERFDLTVDLSPWRSMRGTVSVEVERDPFRPVRATFTNGRSLKLVRTDWTVNERLPRNLEQALYEVEPEVLQGETDG